MGAPEAHPAVDTPTGTQLVEMDKNAAIISEKVLDRPQDRASTVHKYAQMTARLEERLDEVELQISRKTKAYAIFGLGLYLTAGIVFYCVAENWSFIDACYFVVVTVTTTGYGDLIPTTTWSRMFCVLYVFVGVVLLGVLGGVLSAGIVSSAILDTKMAKNSAPRPRAPKCLGIALRSCKKMGCIALNIVLVLGVAVAVYCTMDTEVDELSFEQAFYMAAMTVTTVGYGDYSPKTQGARVFAIFWTSIGVGVVGYNISAIAQIYLRRYVKSFQQRRLKRPITIRDLENFGGADCSLDENEFVLSKLVAQSKITPCDIRECLQQFRAMDVDGSGYVDLTDLMDDRYQDKMDCRFNEMSL